MAATECFSYAGLDPQPAPAATMSVGIVNRTNRPIYVAFRQGPVIRIKPGIPSQIDNTIEVVETLEADNFIRNEFSDIAVTSQTVQIATPMLNEIRKRCSEPPRDGWSNTVESRKDYYRLRSKYPVSCVFNGNKTAYLEAHDIYLIDVDEGHKVVPHPFAGNGTTRLLENRLECESGEKITGLVYKLCVDSPSIDDKFYFVNGQVLQLKPHLDRSCKPGLYVYASDENKGIQATPVVVYPTDRFAENGIFGTEAEAKAYGDDPVKFQISVKQHERELLELKQAYDREKLALEQERAKAVRKLEKFKDHLDEKSAIRKDRGEDRKERTEDRRERSEIRKDENEMYKQLPVMIAAAAGIFMAVKAFF
jgi:hypothetical protein